MKKILFLFAFMAITYFSYPQATVIGELRIQDATTQFDVNLPIGTKVYDLNTGNYWVATAGVASTETLATASGSFQLINSDVPVTSVFGRIGAVIAQAGDYTASQVTNAFDKAIDDTDDISEGSTNKFSQWLENGSDIYYNVGNVGMGTAVPSEKLQVKGNIISDLELSRLLLGVQSSSGDVHFGSSGIVSPSVGQQDYGFYAAHNAYRSSDGSWKHSRTSAIPALRNLGSAGVSLGTSGFYWDWSPNVGTSNITWTNLMFLSTSGDLGIGTNDPDKKLEISTPSGTEASIRIRQLGLNFWDIKSPSSSTRLDIGDVSGDYMTFLTGGNVGIGTTIPSQKFHVVGNSAIDGIVFTDILQTITGDLEIRTGASVNDILFESTAGTGLMTLKGTGNVGIGTTSPSSQLHIYNNGAVGNTKGLILENSTANEQYLLTAGVIGTTSSGFAIYDKTNIANRLVLNSTGNIGIGITTPTEKLHVNGNARITGSLYDSNNSPGTSTQLLSSTVTGTDWISQSSLSFTASQVSDFDTEVSNNSSVVANTAKVTNATHTGDATGSTVLTVVNDSHNHTSTTISGLGVSDFSSPNISQWTNNSGYITDNQTIILSGDITGSGTTSIVTTVLNDSHTHTGSTISGLSDADFTDFDGDVAATPAVIANTAKVTNAAHTGEVAGSGGLAMQATAISNKTLKSSLSGTENVLILDGGLKKTTAQDIADLASAGALTLDDVTTNGNTTTNNITIGDIAVNGGDISTTQSTANIFNNPTTLNIGTASSIVLIGAPSTSVTAIGNNLDVGSGELTTTSSSASVFNGNATTVNAFGSGTNINIGASTGTTTFNNKVTVQSISADSISPLVKVRDNLTTSGTNPNFIMDITGQNNNNPALIFGNDASNNGVIGSDNGQKIRFIEKVGTTWGELAVIDFGSSPGLGISTTDPLSRLDVNGSIGAVIETITANKTLDGNNNTVIITGGTPSITLPSASSVTRRIYSIVNQTGTSRTISSYIDYTGASSTSIPANDAIRIQSDGTNWYKVP